MKKKNIVELTRCDIASFKEKEKNPVRILCDNVRSMYNIGAIFRTSDAFLIDCVILGGISGCPPHPEISKTALGAENSVEWFHVASPLEEVKRLKKEGWKILVLEQTHGSISLEKFHRQPEEKYLLVVGNEVEGVDQKIVDEADL